MLRFNRLGKTALYALICILVLIKVISLNTSYLQECCQKLNYKLNLRHYNVITSYSEFKERKNEIKGIYFGSEECPSCLRTINNSRRILGSGRGIYYFKVDFEDPQSEKELDCFKKEFHFETIPNILVFKKAKFQQYKTKDIYETEFQTKNKF